MNLYEAGLKLEEWLKEPPELIGHDREQELAYKKAIKDFRAALREHTTTPDPAAPSVDSIEMLKRWVALTDKGHDLDTVIVDGERLIADTVSFLANAHASSAEVLADTIEEVFGSADGSTYIDTTLTGKAAKGEHLRLIVLRQGRGG